MHKKHTRRATKKYSCTHINELKNIHPHTQRNIHNYLAKNLHIKCVFAQVQTHTCKMQCVQTKGHTHIHTQTLAYTRKIN